MQKGLLNFLDRAWAIKHRKIIFHIWEEVWEEEEDETTKIFVGRIEVSDRDDDSIETDYIIMSESREDAKKEVIHFLNDYFKDEDYREVD